MHVGPAARVASGGSRTARSLPFHATPPQGDCQKNVRRRSTKSVGGDIAGVSLTLVDAEQQAKYGYGDSGYYYHAYRKYYAQ